MAASLVLRVEANVIQNPDFSAGLTHWRTEGAVFDTGQQGVVTDENASRSYLYQAAAIEAGTLRLVFDFRNLLSATVSSGGLRDTFFASVYLTNTPDQFDLENSSGFSDSISLFDLDSTGAFTIHANGRFEPSPFGNDFTRFTIEFNATTTYAVPAFDLFGQNLVNDDSVVLVDNVSLEGVATPTPPPPTPSPSATATPEPSPTPTPDPSTTPTPTPQPSPTPTATASASPTPGASPTPTVSPSPSASPTATPTPASQLLNISTRLAVLTDENVLICGFIITGAEPKEVLVRTLGPSLTKAGITAPVADPVLELFDSSGQIILSNDNWKDFQRAAIEATTIPPQDDSEAAIVVSLVPGAYTAVMQGKNRGTGIGVLETYDLSRAAKAQLANISTRGFVNTGEDVMIGGFILGGDDGTRRVVLRAIGPSLRSGGVGNALQDPTLELFDGDGTIVTTNDNWRSDQQAELEATGVPPTEDAESAVAVSLSPGAYTAVVRGKDGSTGVGLVEVYALEKSSETKRAATQADGDNVDLLRHTSTGRRAILVP